MIELDGPRLDPASGEKPKQLVIFCHGYGADGNDLIDLGRMWQTVLPDAAFVSPHAPDPCAMSPMGRQWFPITRLDPDEYWDGCQVAGPVLDHFITQECARFELPAKAVALVGFSQGTMMALHTGLRRADQLAAIVGYSGALAGPVHLSEEIKSKPPVLLVHGSHDDVVPVQALPIAVECLERLDVPVTSQVCDGLGHGIDQTGLQLGAGFLRQALGVQEGVQEGVQGA